MRTWFILLGGMIVWAVHFLSLFILASVFESGMIARAGVGLLTLGCAATDAALLVLCWRAIRRSGTDSLVRWIGSLGAVMVGLSLVAVVWQSMPALFG